MCSHKHPIQSIIENARFNFINEKWEKNKLMINDYKKEVKSMKLEL